VVVVASCDAIVWGRSALQEWLDGACCGRRRAFWGAMEVLAHGSSQDSCAAAWTHIYWSSCCAMPVHSAAVRPRAAASGDAACAAAVAAVVWAVFHVKLGQDCRKFKFKCRCGPNHSARFCGCPGPLFAFNSPYQWEYRRGGTSNSLPGSCPTQGPD